MQRLAFLLILLDLIRANELGNCGKGGHVQCCLNFVLKNGKCVACPLGKFGESCMEYCPYGRYGESCLNKCNCSAGQICHHGIGCIHSPERSKESFDACSQNKLKIGVLPCCVNQRTLGNQCQECWMGKYGEHCKYTCPAGRYGRFCLETCNCTTNETCNRVTGCIACPLGIYGKSCMEYCPYGIYGERCLNKCNCSAGQICHYGIGCTESPERSKESFDACLQSKWRTGNRRCCVNQRMAGNRCLECWNGNYGEHCKRHALPVDTGDYVWRLATCTTNETCNRVTGCRACPSGKYGKDCMEYCPYGFYGERCSNKCNCSAGQICHYGIGCTKSPERSKESFDACSQSKLRTGNRRCCVNERPVGNQCLECWNGRYGEYCKNTCPVGRYGRFCLETCNCTANGTCNRVTGCRGTTATTTNISPDKGTISSLLTGVDGNMSTPWGQGAFNVFHYYIQGLSIDEYYDKFPDKTNLMIFMDPKTATGNF